MSQPAFYLRINGIAHAFCRQLGCECGRCATINYGMARPPGVLAPFPGWPDPPWRAQTSVSLLIPDPERPTHIAKHILIDVGSGVVESLAASGIPGIENVQALLLTHWHPDHVLGLNQLGARLKRAGSAVSPVPVYCHADTFAKVSETFPHDRKHNFRHEGVTNGVPFFIDSFTFVPFLVGHLNYKGCVVFVCTEKYTGLKMIFAWDIDTPDSTCPTCARTNLEVFQHDAFKDADLMILDCNTWQVSSFVKDSKPRRTGHTSFLEGWKYVETCQPGALGIIHLSGHEDDQTPYKTGYGWSDGVWLREARKYAAAHPFGTRSVRVLDLLQGTVLACDQLRPPAAVP